MPRSVIFRLFSGCIRESGSATSLAYKVRSCIIVGTNDACRFAEVEFFSSVSEYCSDQRSIGSQKGTSVRYLNVAIAIRDYATESRATPVLGVFWYYAQCTPMKYEKSLIPTSSPQRHGCDPVCVISQKCQPTFTFVRRSVQRTTVLLETALR